VKDRITINLGMIIVVILFIGLASVLIVAGFYFWKFPNELSSQHITWGEFGSYFGGALGPVLSFLALIGVLLTLHMQNEQLVDQQLISTATVRIACAAILVDSNNEDIAHERDSIKNGKGNPQYLKDLEAQRHKFLKDAKETSDAIGALLIRFR
jgi:uncharacterized membrane protein